MNKTCAFRLACRIALLAILAGNSLNTAPAAPLERPVRIALMSDTHITRGSREDQPFHRGRLERTILAINAEAVDAVVIAGDLTENGTPAELTDFRKIIRPLRAPVYCVPGNHDVGGKVIAGKESSKDITAGRLSRFEWKLGPSWFAQDVKGVRVLGVNSALFGSGLSQETAMWRFLEQELGTPNARPTLMVTHYPPFTRKPDEAGSVYWNIEPGPRKRLLDLAHGSGVKAVLSGHLHTEAMFRQNGMLFVTTPPVSFGIPKGRQYRGWTLITVTPAGEVAADFRYQVD